MIARIIAYVLLAGGAVLVWTTLTTTPTFEERNRMAPEFAIFLAIAARIVQAEGKPKA
jgi:hypothetical protein